MSHNEGGGGISGVEVGGGITVGGMSPTTEGGGGISVGGMSPTTEGGGGISGAGMSPTTEGGGISGAGMSGIGGGGISGAGMSGIGGGGGISGAGMSGIGGGGGMTDTEGGGGISGAGMSGIGGGMPSTTEEGGGISDAGIGACADAGFTGETGVMGALLSSSLGKETSISKESALSSAGLERVRSGAFWSFLKNRVRLCSVTSVLSSPSSALSKSPRQSFRKRCDAIPPERTSLDLELSTPGMLLTRSMLKERSFL